jgi:hypothetical protein
MDIRKFRKKYDLNLIPASHEGINLGTLVWNPLLSAPSFSYKGMPKHILNAFLDAELLSKSEWSVMQTSLQKVPQIVANFADKNIRVELNSIAEFNNPVINKVLSKIELMSIRKFKFGNLKARIMPDITRVEIDGLLESLKINNWREYDGKIRRVYMITELYYGDIKILLSKGIRAEKIFQTSIDSDINQEYNFSHQEVPFAMKLERVRYFNG